MVAVREPVSSGNVNAKHVTIGGVWVDVSVEEGYRLSADVTKSPVESGADIATHVRPRPEVVTIKGIVSNHPIELPGSHVDGVGVDRSSLEADGEPALLSLPIVGVIPGLGQAQAIGSNFGGDLRSYKRLAIDALHFTADFDRVEAVDSALREVVLAGQPVAVVTGLRTYSAMVLSDLDVRRDASTGDALHFTVQAEEVSIVDSETGVEVPDPVHERSKGKGNGGKVDAAEATNTDGLRRSGAAKLLGF